MRTARLRRTSGTARCRRWRHLTMRLCLRPDGPRTVDAYAVDQTQIAALPVRNRGDQLAEAKQRLEG